MFSLFFLDMTYTHHLLPNERSPVRLTEHPSMTISLNRHILHSSYEDLGTPLIQPNNRIMVFHTSLPRNIIELTKNIL